MDFFKNKTVRLVACVLLALSLAVLLIGGIPQEAITDLIAKVVAALSAATELIAAIIEMIEKLKKGKA